MGRERPLASRRTRAVIVADVTFRHLSLMHPFPPPDTLAFLVGKEIGQITFDPWSTQFRFSDAGCLSIEGKFEHQDATGQSRSYQDSEEQDRGTVFFRDLLQQTVVRVAVEPLLLTLTFTNGSVLRIFSDEAPYECGQIFRSNDPADIIVF
jgi:hypothetical protein